MPDDEVVSRCQTLPPKVLTRLTMPEGTEVSGQESDQGDLFYAGGGGSGRVRAGWKPRRRPGR